MMYAFGSMANSEKRYTMEPWSTGAIMDDLVSKLGQIIQIDRN